MDDFNMLPEADRYLLVLLTELSLGKGLAPHEEASLRAMAGLILKNNLRKRDELTLDTINFFKSWREAGLLNVLGDPQPLVRNTTGTVLATLATRLGRDLGRYWPELLPALIQLTTSADSAPMQLAASETLVKVAEDAVGELIQDSSEPSNFLIPALIHLADQHQTEQIRANSIMALCSFLSEGGNVVEGHIEPLLGVLSRRASCDRSPDMKKAICRALTLLQRNFSEEMIAIVPAVTDYMFEMVQLNSDGDEAVALEACEFWLSLAESDVATELLQDLLPKLVSILLRNMIYSDDDPDLEFNRENTGTKDDRMEVLKPRHHTSSIHSNQNAQSVREEGEISPQGDLEQSDGSDDAEDGEDNEEVGHWSLRKCSAATLDVLAASLDENILMSHLLPLLQPMLNSYDWRHRECAILALGAVAEGCMDSIKPHLPSIIPFLLINLHHAEQQQSYSVPPPLLRSISLWTLSRYAAWVEAEAEIGLANGCVVAILHAMLNTGNERVQHAACTTLSVFAEKAKGLLGSHLSGTIKAVIFGLQHYYRRTLMVLYDLIDEIATQLGDGLRACPTDLLTALFEGLLRRWETTPEEDPSLLALLGCLCPLALALPSFLPPAVAFNNCLILVERTLAQAALAPENEIYDVNYDFVVVAFDLISALVQGGTVHGFIGESSLLKLLSPCFHSESVTVRQAAFALLGDMAQHCPASLAEGPFLSQIALPSILANCDARSEEVSQDSANNAIWSLSELILALPNLIAPHATQLMPQLCGLLVYQDRTVGRGYLENVAVCLGRILALCPATGIPLEWPQLLPRWAQVISRVADPVERESAWLPVCDWLIAFPNFLTVQTVPVLLRAIHLFPRPPAGLEAQFTRLVQLIRDTVTPARWPEYRRSLGAEVPPAFDVRFSAVLI